MKVYRKQLEQTLAAMCDDTTQDRVGVLLSGGVDSAVVAAAAKSALGAKALCITVRHEFISGYDLSWAVKVAQHLGMEHKVLDIRLLDDSSIRAHENDRCYRCKRAVCLAAKEQVTPLLVDGTTSDDDPSRPGRRALHEMNVRSPLELCRFGKGRVRALALEYKLPNASRPSNSCLATRLERGRVITREDLARVARLEEVLRELGFKDVRARVSDLKVIVEMEAGSEALLEKGHRRIMDTIKGLGLTLAGYAPRRSGNDRA